MAKLISRLTTTALLAGFVATSLSCAALQPACAQGLKHFYMARQQVQITDDAPMVNDQRTFPQGGQQQGGMGALPNRPMALPRAGFQQYSPTQPSFNTSLPQVVNGVPPKEQPQQQGPTGKKAKTGKYKPTNKQQTATNKTAAPVQTTAKSYSPYKGYNPGAAPVNQGATANGASNMQSKTRVKGSVLHWARGR